MEIVCKYWLRHEQVQSAIKEMRERCVYKELQGSIPQAKAKKIIVFLHRKNFCTSCIFEKISYVTQFPTITFFRIIEHFVGCRV